MGLVRRKKPVANPRPQLRELVALARALGAERTGGPLSIAEERLLRDGTAKPATAVVRQAKQAIARLEDPLGNRFCELVPAAARRPLGAFYTQPQLVEAMCRWILDHEPARIIDTGCGSGRFSAFVRTHAPDVEVVAVDIDPVATILTRATLACLGRKGRVINGDYLSVDIDEIDGVTGFVGNPPYVRHHELAPEDKARARRLAADLGVPCSGLAGLHAHFFLATAKLASPGDVGSFITSAEWLDVGYGELIRALLTTRLPGKRLHVLTPSATPFDDAMTTAAITCFKAGGQHKSTKLKSVATVEQLAALKGGRSVRHARLAEANRWSPLVRGEIRTSDGMVRLGDIARVHRGVVTGNNKFFVMTQERAKELGIAEFCRPAITSAKEIIESRGVLRRRSATKVILDLDAAVNLADHPALEQYLSGGEAEGINEGYIASHRRPWWRVAAPKPAPIVASYMARQPPTFALNPDRLVLLNIAHGLYPRNKMTRRAAAALVSALNEHRENFRGRGRTYHGGLEKFEPREMENLLVPSSFAP